MHANCALKMLQQCIYNVAISLHGGTGAQSSGSLPPPPWEAHSTEDSSPVTSAQYPSMIVTHAPGGLHPQGPHQMGNEQVVGMYIQPITSGHLSAINSQVRPTNQLGLHPHAMQGGPYMGMLPQPMQAGHMGTMYSQPMYGNHMAGYGYGQQQGHQYLDQRMYGLSVRDDSSVGNNYQVSTSSYVPPSKPSKPEDKLFGDLVNMAKFKSNKTTPGRADSM